MLDLQKKINKLESLLEVSKLLNSSRNTDEILISLLEKSIELVEGADTGFIFIYNKDNGMLETRASVGYDSSLMNDKLLPGESVSGITFINKKTTFIYGSEEVKRAMSTMSDENKASLEKSLKTTIDESEIYGCICCPLMHKEDCIGVIIINNLQNRAPLTFDDVMLIEAVSVQATIAIINAQNYEKEIRNNKIIEKYSQMQEREKKKYQYSSSLQDKFINMIINKGNINDILIELSRLLEKDIFIIDIFNNIDYYCFNYYADLDTINVIFCDSSLNLSQIQETIHIDNDYNLHMIYFPILVNIDLLGWLCVVSNDDHYSELDKITIEVGISTLALELLKIKDLNSIEQSFKGDFFDNLILNNNREYLIKCSKKYKFNFDRDHRIIIFGFKANENNQGIIVDNIELKRYIQQYYNIVNDKANSILKNPITLIKGNNIIVITEEDNNGKKIIKDFLDKEINIKNNIFRGKFKIISGISSIIQGIDGFKPSYFATQQVIRMLDNEDIENSYIFYEDLEIRKLLLNNSNEDLEKFLSMTLGPLFEYEKDTKEYLNTLKVYIQSNGNWTYTKDHLHIHGNTLSYRLNRIKDILNINLNDYYDRLKIQIALEIYDILK